MGNGPAPFSEIGRRVRDLLTKDYNFDQKFIFTVARDSGLGLTATGVKINHLFVGDINTQYRSGNSYIDVKVDVNSNILTTVTLDEIVSGAKAAISFKIPDHRSSKLDVQYLHHHAAFNSSIGLTPTPLLEIATAIGRKELSVGAEVGFDTASASFTKYNAGVGFNQDDFSATLMLTDKGETLKGSYIHVVDPIKGMSVAAEITHRFNTYEDTFTIGSSHVLSPFTAVKTRFSSNGKLAMVCQQEWRPNSCITLSTEYDSKSISSPTKVGVALALKP